MKMSELLVASGPTGPKLAEEWLGRLETQVIEATCNSPDERPTRSEIAEIARLVLHSAVLDLDTKDLKRLTALRKRHQAIWPTLRQWQQSLVDALGDDDYKAFVVDLNIVVAQRQLADIKALLPLGLLLLGLFTLGSWISNHRA